MRMPAASHGFSFFLELTCPWLRVASRIHSLTVLLMIHVSHFPHFREKNFKPVFFFHLFLNGFSSRTTITSYLFSNRGVCFFFNVFLAVFLLRTLNEACWFFLSFSVLYQRTFVLVLSLTCVCAPGPHSTFYLRAHLPLTFMPLAFMHTYY